MASTLPVAQSRIVARLAAGDLKDATPAEALTLLDIEEVDETSSNTKNNKTISNLHGLRWENNSRNGFIKMFHYGPGKRDWLVLDPHGDVVSQTGTITDGLQEAVDAMSAPGTDPDFPLRILGAGVIAPQVTTTFPPMTTQQVYMDAGIISANITDATPIFRFQSMMNCDIHMLGKIVYSGSGPCILLKAEGVVEAATAITNSRFIFTTIDAIGSISLGNEATGIEIDRTFGPYLQNSLEVMKIAVDGDIEGGKGLVIKDGTIGVRENDFFIYDIRQANIGCQIGETSGVGIAQNRFFVVQSVAKGTNPIGMQIHSQDSEYTYILDNDPVGAIGVQWENDASGNSIRILKNVATTPLVDNSATKNNAYITGGRIAASVHRNAVDQTAIVTATWTKLELDTEVYDMGTLYDAVTNYRWTPGILGRVKITARAAWDIPVDATLAGISVYKNGASLKELKIGFSGTVSGQGPSIEVSDLVTVATDYYEIWVWHNMGINKDIKGEIAETYAMFERIN